MAKAPTFTTFDPIYSLTNPLTVPEWKEHLGWRWTALTWAAVARKYAQERGGALVMLADDTLVAYTRRGQKKGAFWVHMKVYGPGTWGWATPEQAEKRAR